MNHILIKFLPGIDSVQAKHSLISTVLHEFSWAVVFLEALFAFQSVCSNRNLECTQMRFAIICK